MRDFNHTVNVLVKAYLNGTLAHGTCEYCAVGNIVFAAGFKRYGEMRMPNDSCANWKALFHTSRGVQKKPKFTNPEWEELGRKCIAKTGYKETELAKVEFAFETARKGNSEDEWMFNGLMAVVNVLAEIHNIDLTVRESAKLLFVKA